MLLFFLVFCSVGCPMLPVSLDCPFLLAISVFSNVYLHYWHIAIPVLSIQTITRCAFHLYDEVVHWLTEGIQFFMSNPVSSTDSTDKTEVTKKFKWCLNQSKSDKSCFSNINQLSINMINMNYSFHIGRLDMNIRKNKNYNYKNHVLFNSVIR